VPRYRRTLTIKNQGVPYQVTSNIAVYSTTGGSPVLTIEPGVTVKFNQSAGLSIGWSSYSYPGRFLPLERHLHRSCSTSSKATPAPGDWSGIDFGNGTVDGTTVLDYVTVEYAGGTANLYLYKRQSLHEKTARSGKVPATASICTPLRR